MDWREDYISTIPGKHLADEPMCRHTTFRIGGPADLFSIPEDTAALVRAIGFLSERGICTIVIGGGSNMLFDDAGFRGAVLRAPARAVGIADISTNNNSVRVAAGVTLQKLVIFCARSGLSGLENLAGIPGTVGGALVMNAGAFGTAISDTIVNVTYHTPGEGIIIKNKKELEFSYRMSSFQTQPQTAILDAEFCFQNDNPTRLLACISEIMAERRRKQPPWTPCAGSYFRNPPGAEPAGKIIESLGLKGLTVGGAKISEQHANFIVNTGTATCRDVLKLENIIVEKVKKEADISLIREVRLIATE